MDGFVNGGSRWLGPVLLLTLTILGSATVGAVEKSQVSPPVWVEFDEHAGIAYLLRKSPAQVMRYDLNALAWLAPISLPRIPSAMAVGGASLYIAYGREIKALDLDGNNERHLTNTVEDVTDMALDGAVLFAVMPAGYDSGILSYNVNTNQRVDNSGLGIYGLNGMSVAASVNRLFGRSTGVSPSDIRYLDYTSDGAFGVGGDSPYHGDYPSALKTWVFPDDSRVADSSGTVYHTADLSYSGSFGTSITDVDFLGSDVPIVLLEDQLLSFSNVLLEAGRTTLPRPGVNLKVWGNNVVVFTEDSSAPTEVTVEVIPLADLTPPDPGQPIEPVGLAYEIEDSVISSDGQVFIADKAHSSVYIWDARQLQTYTASIPIPQPPERLVYNESLRALFVYTAGRTIYKVTGRDASSVEPFVNTPLAVDTLFALDQELLALRNGSWDDQWVYGETGNLITSSVNCCYADFHFYNRPNQRLYVDGGWWTYLGNGQFDFSRDTFRFSGSPPLAISFNSQLLVDGDGVIYDANSMEAIDTLSNDVLAAGWNNRSVLYTIERVNTYQQTSANLQRWNEYYVDTIEKRVNGSPVALHIHDQNVVLITQGENSPVFNVFGPELDIVAPLSLVTPTLMLDSFSAFAAALSWNDVVGEAGYVLERQTVGGAGWQVLATVDFGVDSYTDTTLVPGEIYQYRVKAVNGSLASGFSDTVEVDLTSAVDTRVDPESVPFSVDQAIMAANGRAYLLVREHESIFVWDTAVQQWATTVPLLGAPTFLTYSADQSVLFTSYSDGSIYSISTEAENPVEFLFAQFDNGSTCGLISTGRYLISCGSPGAWDSYRSYNATGQIVHSSEWRYPIAGGIWSAQNGEIYHFRDGTSPNDLNRTAVDAEGFVEGTVDSPYHSSSGIQYPILATPDGRHIILGSGRIYDATTLEHIDDMPAPISMGAWMGNQLISAAGATLYFHSPTDYSPTAVPLSDPVTHLLSPAPDRVLLILDSPGQASGTGLQLLDENFEIIPPPVFIDGFEAR